MERTQATRLYEAVFRNFYNDETGIFLECAPPKEGDRETCFLFPYFATTGLMYRALKAGIGELAQYQKIVEGFAFYRSQPFGEDLAKYHSERGQAPGEGHGPVFFDDNIWVARNFLFAYELLKEPRYLEEAQRIVRFTYTAWDNNLGGLVWNENGLGENATEQELERGLSANACCILVNALLYQLTGKESYLEWARKFYDFCKKTQDPESKIYYNGIHTVLENGRRKAGAVNRDLYSYNPGSMILADLTLYEITGDAAYYEDAELAALAAHQAFIRFGAEKALDFYQDFVWFLAILAEACQALSEAGSGAGVPIMAVFETALDYAQQHYTRSSGLLPHDYVSGWRTPEQDDEYDRLLLTHAGTAEIAILLLGFTNAKTPTSL